MDNLLSILIFTPLLAGLILAIFLRGDDDAARQNAKWLALTATGATFFVALALFVGFEPANLGFQFEESRVALFGLSYRLGVDGISLGFVMLTAALMPLAVGMSWTLTERVKEFVIALLTLETALLGAFLALDVVIFVFFFELAVIPAYLMAGLWGRKASGVSALKAWLYTLPGTVLMIFALMAMAREAGTTDIADLLRHNFASEGQGALWLMIAASVALKAGIWPLHTWLPGLALRAPLVVGMLISVLVLKLGLYGFIRLSLSMLPAGTEAYGTVLMALAGIGIVLALLAAFAEEDLGRLLAYVAVSQTGIVVLSLVARGGMSFDGATMAIVSQGLALAGLFGLALMLEERGGTREVSGFGALKVRMPRLSWAFMILVLALAGMPGSGGFVALVLNALGVFPVSVAAAVVLAVGTALTAALALVLYRKIMLGGLVKETLKLVPDLQRREQVIVGLIIASLLLLGLFPGLLLDRTAPALTELASQLATLQ
ncbi:MAG: NADH-quinone oxidoreductase subunit M [Pseudomonadota bacterium]